MVWSTKDDQDRISIRATDVQRLNEEGFLNDVIINFYLKYLFQVRRVLLTRLLSGAVPPQHPPLHVRV